MVSIVITERERFTLAKASLLTLLRHREGVSEIIYIGSLTPAPLAFFLRGLQKKEKIFRFFPQNRDLPSNEARNLGLSRARKSNDLVFLDNDVLVQRGWLPPLILCSRERGASVVAPLVLEGGFQGVPTRIHDAGASFLEDPAGNRRLVHEAHQKALDWKKLKRKEVDVVEFHCLFVKRKAMEKVTLDPRWRDLAAHLDFSLECNRQKIKIMVEPKSKVVFSHLNSVPLSDPLDLRYFLEVWKEKNCRSEISLLAKKWGLSPKVHYLWEKRAWAVLYKAEGCEPPGNPFFP